MGALAEFCNFDESRPKSELTAEINEAQSHALLKTLAKNWKSFHYTENFCKKCEKISLYLAEVSVYLAEDLYAIGRSTTGTFISPLRYFKNFSASAPSAPYSIFEKASASFKKRQSRKSKTISHFSHSFLVVLREIAKTSDFLQKKSHPIQLIKLDFVTFSLYFSL